MERKWWTLLAVCVATFMLLLDITVVNVALPSIQAELDASLSSLQWVVDAYALTLASFLLVFGSLGDRIGRRRIFTVGFALFTVSSLLCGLASDPTVLNVVPGAAGRRRRRHVRHRPGADRPGVRGPRAGHRDRHLGRDRGRGRGRRPARRRPLTDAFGWEWIFFVNVPIGLAAIVLTEVKLTNVAASEPERIDWAGVATFSLSLFALIFGLIRGNAEGWGSPQILVSLIGAAVLMAAFVVIERRSDHAMLELSLFREPAFAGVSIVAFALSAGMFAMFLYLTLYIQDVLGYSPLEAGRALPPDHAARRSSPRRSRPAARRGYRCAC